MALLCLNLLVPLEKSITPNQLIAFMIRWNISILIVSSRIVHHHAQAMAAHWIILWGWKWYKSYAMALKLTRSQPNWTIMGDGVLYHHKNTNWGKIFWKNDVNRSTTVSHSGPTFFSLFVLNFSICMRFCIFHKLARSFLNKLFGHFKFSIFNPINAAFNIICECVNYQRKYLCVCLLSHLCDWLRNEETGFRGFKRKLTYCNSTTYWKVVVFLR